jgi:AcrR family transcriptional regulator
MSGQKTPDAGDAAPALRRYGGRGGEERRAERRARLLEAGLQVFGQAGFHGATVRMICAQAGLTERYFYESFGNSEDLLCAVYEQHMALQQERIATALLGAPRESLAMLEAGLRAFLELARENPAGSRVQFVEVLGVSPRVDKLYRKAIEDFARLMRGWNTQLSPEGSRLLGDEDTLLVGLVGAAVGIASRWLLSGFAQPLEVMLQTMLTIFRGVWQQTSPPA